MFMVKMMRACLKELGGEFLHSCPSEVYIDFGACILVNS